MARMQRNYKTGARLAALVIGLTMIGCGSKAPLDENSPVGKTTLTVLASSELKDLEPYLKRVSAEVDIDLRLTYRGSVDTMMELQNTASTYDCVWPASSVWLAIGDKSRRVVAKSPIFSSPVVFAVKNSKVDQLGWRGKSILVQDILAKAKDGSLRWAMTSATQSNSGAMAYLGYLQALSGKPGTLTNEDLKESALTGKLRELLRTVDRSSASTGFQTDKYLADPSTIDAMVTYESEVIRANRTRQGAADPLYAFYPEGGTAIADYPLANTHAEKSELFSKLTERLLRDDAQQTFLANGRRRAELGITIQNPDTTVFNPAWGIDTKRVITPITIPGVSTLEAALGLYQSALRKPSLTVYVLDYSGSMAMNGGELQLKAAMRLLLDPAQAKRYFLQPTPEDVSIFIAFSSGTPDVWRVNGNNPEDLKRVLDSLNNRAADGGTNLYEALNNGLAAIAKFPADGKYFKSLILMSDGEPSDDQNRPGHQGYRGDIPIYAISFGEADMAVMKWIAETSGAKAFDGAKDLQSAFRDAKGYN